MKTPASFFIPIILLVFSLPGFSQFAGEETIMLQQITVAEKELLQPKDIEANTLSIKQDGMNNRLFMEQSGSNYAAIHQAGSFNRVFLQQTTSAGGFKLLQSGASNQYQGAISGTDIEISVVQHGGYNAIDQTAVGEQVIFNIIQEGNHNTIQHQTESSDLSLRIHQRGSDMKLIIKSNN